MNNNQAAQATCISLFGGGCCVHPNFWNMPQMWNTAPVFVAPSLCAETPKFYSTPSLEEDEKEVLKNLSLAWEAFSKLADSKDCDKSEFLDATHRAQQIIALRVARRVNPEVWSQ
jgi:hypothetical protein